jgi:GNAT superfamily N-acetyltransferase
MELLAPNGKPSNLSNEQYLIVRTPEFKQWFGDWEKLALTKLYDSGIDEISLKKLEDSVSKVVDENGEPLMVYHGTNTEFTSFSKDKINSATGFGDFGAGFYFTAFHNTAKYYTLKFENGRFIMSVFLNIRNPFIIELNWEKLSKESIERYKNLKTLDYEKEVINNSLLDEYRPSKRISKEIGDWRFQEILSTNGFDGVFANRINIHEKSSINLEDEILYLHEIIAFKNTQIKLADGTNKTFDSNNPDIRFENGGKISIEPIENKLANNYLKRNDSYGQFVAKNGKSFYLTLNKSPYPNVKVFDAKKLDYALSQGYGIDEIARAFFNVDYNTKTFSGYSENQSIFVDEEYRRLGIATAITDFAEEKLGMKYLPSKLLSPEMQKFVDNRFMYKKGGRTIAQTPAPLNERIYGSNVNKKQSSSNLKNAKSIKFDEKTIQTISEKVKEHNKLHSDKKITLESAKAVVRRGMGAYSKSHRPTISDNKPNSRVAWGLARLNAFIYKIINGKSKSGKYKQDDDLIKELGIMVKNYEQGGDIPKANKMFHLPIELTVYVPSTQDVDKTITKAEMTARVNEVKTYLGKTFGGFSASDVQGGFVASDGNIVSEDIIKVVSFAQKEDYEKHKEQLVKKITEWAEKWGQEAIGLEYEGDLYYVPEKLKHGGSVSNKEIKEENYWEGWGFEDTIKVLMKGEKNNVFAAFKDLQIAFPKSDKEILENKIIELFIDEKDIKRAKKIADANKLTLMYEDGGEIDYSQGWNQDYENDPLVKAKRKAKELATRAALAYATAGTSEVARAEGQAIQQGLSSFQQPTSQGSSQSMSQQQINPEMLQMLSKSGALTKMERGGSIDYNLGGKQTNTDVNKAFEYVSDKNVSLKEMFKRGGVTPSQQNKIARVMREFKKGKLHSGSKKGPIVEDREQAIAIALSEAGVSNKK